MSSNKKQIGALAMAALATLMASSCCVGPLLLVMLGLGGAWVGSLKLLEPYKYIFLAVAAIAMIMAFRRIYRPVAECLPGEVCALPRTRMIYKAAFWLVLGLIALTLMFPYVAKYFY